MLAVWGCGTPEPAAPQADLGLRPATSAERVPPDFLTPVPDGSFGPYLGLNSEQAVLIWAAPAQQEEEVDEDDEDDDEEAATGMQWFSRPLDLVGRALEPSEALAPAPESLDLVRVRTDATGFSVLATSTSGSEFVLQDMRLNADGTLAAPPVQLTSSPNEIVWIDIVPTQAGFLVLWAERGAERAELFALALGPSGQPKTPHTRLHGDAIGWQVLDVPRGALLALITQGRTLELLLVGDDANVLKENSVAASRNTGSGVDLMHSGRKVIAAYADAVGLERRIFTLELTPEGEPLGTPRQLTEPHGDQILQGWVPGASVPTLSWLEPAQRPGHLASGTLGADGALSAPPIQLPLHRGEAPELEASKDGYAALLWGCVEAVGCQQPVVPYALSLDAALEPTGALVLSQGRKLADLAWDLQCEEERCVALTARFTHPPHVQMLALDPGKKVLALPKLREEVRRPRGTAIEAFVERESLAAFGQYRSSAGSVVVTLTNFDPDTPYVERTTPAPDGRKAPLRAELSTNFLPTTAVDEAPAPEVISYRARSVAGIALAQRREAHLLVWSALDKGRPQVFMTLLDARGKKLSQAMLTRAAGEVRMLSAAPWEKGWLVAWVDEREGEPRAFVAKLGPKLRRLSGDTRLDTGNQRVTGVDVHALGRELEVVTSGMSGGVGRVMRHALKLYNMQPAGPSTTLASVDGDISGVRFSTGDASLISWKNAEKGAELMRLGPTQSQVVSWLEDALSVTTDCNADRCIAAGVVPEARASSVDAGATVVVARFEPTSLPKGKPSKVARLVHKDMGSLPPIIDSSGQLWVADSQELTTDLPRSELIPPGALMTARVERVQVLW